MKFFKTLSVLSFLLGGIGTVCAAPSQPLKVVVTLRPLYSLAASIMKGAGTPHLLLKGPADPHHFSLAPSHARLIKEADLVVWVGPILESFMVKPLLEHKKRRATLMFIEGLHRLYGKKGHGCLAGHACESTLQKGEHTHEHTHALLDGHKYEGMDPHIWLDIENAILMVKEITFHLAALDLLNAPLYQSNAQALVKKLNAFRNEMAEMAKPLDQFPFIAFHNAYGYLEHRYQMKNAAADVLKGHGSPSLKAFSEIRHRIKQQNIRCLLVDPQHPVAVTETLAKEFDMSVYQADPLGVEIEVGPAHFFELMRGLMQQFLECHQKNGSKA